LLFIHSLTILVDTQNFPEDTSNTLMRAAILPDLEVDDLVSLTEIVLLHLKSKQNQRHLIDTDMFDYLLRILIRTYFIDADLLQQNLPDILLLQVSAQDADEEIELTKLRNSIVQTLADISALDEFTEKYASCSHPINLTLLKWLSARQSTIQQSSCIVLGNLACSDDVCLMMVDEINIHEELFRILRQSSDSQLIHAALGFLRNLALPAENKRILGAAGTIEVLTRFWTSDPLPQISHLAAAVARQLVNDSFANVHKLLTSLSSDKDSPAFFRTYLSLLLSNFEKSDEVVVKIEVARVITAILRCVYSQQTLQPARDELLDRLYTLHPNLAQPVAGMVTQSQFPVVRSEGWFALALMARSAKAKPIISKVVLDFALLNLLEKTIRGESGEFSTDSRSLSVTPQGTFPSPLSPSSQSPIPAQQQDMKFKDRQNALILVNELIRSGVGIQLSGFFIPLASLV
jgi:hypothetical protein